MVPGSLHTYLLSLDFHLVLCSKKYNFNPYAAEEGKRMVLSMSPIDWAAEWLRPVSPSYKYVGPVLAGPGKALPADLEVRRCLCMCSLRSFSSARISCGIVIVNVIVILSLLKLLLLLLLLSLLLLLLLLLHASPTKREARCVLRHAAVKGCQVPSPCWTRQIQVRPNQPPPASRGQGMV